PPNSPPSPTTCAPSSATAPAGHSAACPPACASSTSVWRTAPPASPWRVRTHTPAKRTSTAPAAHSTSRPPPKRNTAPIPGSTRKPIDPLSFTGFSSNGWSVNRDYPCRTQKQIHRRQQCRLGGYPPVIPCQGHPGLHPLQA